MAPSGGRPSHDVDLLIAMILAEMLDGSGDQGGGPRPATAERDREDRRRASGTSRPGDTTPDD